MCVYKYNVCVHTHTHIIFISVSLENPNEYNAKPQNCIHKEMRIKTIMLTGNIFGTLKAENCPMMNSDLTRIKSTTRSA